MRVREEEEMAVERLVARPEEGLDDEGLVSDFREFDQKEVHDCLRHVEGKGGIEGMKVLLRSDPMALR